MNQQEREMELALNWDEGVAENRDLDLLCQHLIEKKSYSLPVFEKNNKLVSIGKGFNIDYEYPLIPLPEIASWEPYFDRVLVLLDGYVLHLACFRNKNSSKANPPPVETLRELAQNLLPYTGKLNRVKMPVHIDLVEFLDSQAPREEFYKKSSIPGRKKVSLRSIALDLAQQKVFSTGNVLTSYFIRKFYQNSLTEIAASSASSDTPSIVTRFLYPPEADTSPYLTYFFLLLFASIYGVSSYLSGNPLDQDLIILHTMGGASKDLVLRDLQFYRLLSCAFLHANILHLALNGFAFYWGGKIIEHYLSRSWLLVIFVLSAIFGSLLSVYGNPDTTLSVGASGGILGMMSACLLSSFFVKPGPDRSYIQINSFYLLVPALIPVGSSSIDYFSHLGGAIGGLLIGFFLFFMAKKRPLVEHASGKLSLDINLKPWRNILLYVSISLIAITSFQSYRYFHRNLPLTGYSKIILPSELFQKVEDAINNKDFSIQSTVEENIKKYPEDPRVFYQAIKFEISKENIDWEKVEDYTKQGTLCLHKHRAAFEGVGLEKFFFLVLEEIEAQKNSKNSPYNHQ